MMLLKLLLFMAFPVFWIGKAHKDRKKLNEIDKFVAENDTKDMREINKKEVAK
jgi:hypothetical protein